MWQLSDAELAESVLACQQVLSAEYARMLGLLAEAGQRGLAGSLGYRDLVVWQAQELRVSVREAKNRLVQADTLIQGPGSTSGDGSACGAGLATIEALSSGVVTPEHTGEIARVIRQVPVLERDETEHTLLALARQASPATVRRAGQRVVAYLDPDGACPAEQELAEPQREFRYRIDRRGWMRFTGDTDPETAVMLAGLFTILAKPEPAVEGIPDQRSLPERYGDALAEIIDLAARADELPTKGGERAVVTVTIGLDELQQRAQTALLDRGTGWTSVSALRRLCCEAKLIPAVLGGHGEVLDLGRGARLATTAQRAALALRDRGCAFPGCTRGPKWCTPHHWRHWADGGPTTLDNLVLLCARHHRHIHHTDWHMRITHGVPEFIPPPRIDPRRTPRRNIAHHPPTPQAA